jgi:CheY-like chemotaxis protein
MEKMLRRLIGEDIELTFTPAAGPTRVKADPGQVEQVLMNLVVNARDAMPRGGRLTIAVTAADLDDAYARRHPGVTPGQYVLVRVADTGCGMDRETQSRIFEPFFTTKEEGKGTGLGLSTVYGIVKQSGGHIGVTSAVGRGTTFEVYLPRVADAPVDASSDALPAPLGQGSETILLVDDDEGVRSSIRDFLAMAGYTVLQASNATDAMGALQQHDGPVHLLITDVIMPGLSGRELAARIAALSPETKVLFMSGYTDDAIAQYGMLEPGAAFIQKPFSPRQFMGKLRQMLDGTETPAEARANG